MELDLKCKTPILFYTDDELKSILKIRGKTLEQLPEDVKIIKEWLKTQPHLPLHPTDRQIVCFLVMNKFSIERTKEKLDSNYTIKALIPEFYSKIPSHPDIKKIMSSATFGYMPKLSKNLNRMIVGRLINSDNFNTTDLFSFLCILYEIRSISDFSDSDEFLYDFTYCPISVISKFSLMDSKRILTIIEKVYSNRLASIHYINVPAYAESVINMVKSLLKPKIRERLHIHKGYESLRKFFEEDQLPKEWGGSGPSLTEIEDNMGALCSENEEYVEKMFNARVDESLRPTKLVNDDFLGYHGNFKKLQVD